jgi:hypothetical protein
MSSNRYFQNWEKNFENNDSNHLKLLKKIDKDIDRLDRTIDKIKTEKKAHEIFAYGKQTNNQFIGGILTQQIQLQLQLPIQIQYNVPKYIVINGCVVIL